MHRNICTVSANSHIMVPRRTIQIKVILSFLGKRIQSINFNYMEIHNHEKRHLKNTERISNKEKKKVMQTMAAIFMSHLRRRSAQVWDWFCMSE